MAHLGIMPYVDRFSQNFPLARWSVSYLLVYTWHTLLHYPHGANAGCDLAGVAPVRDTTLLNTKCVDDGVKCYQIVARNDNKSVAMHQSNYATLPESFQVVVVSWWRHQMETT